MIYSDNLGSVAGDLETGDCFDNEADILDL